MQYSDLVIIYITRAFSLLKDTWRDNPFCFTHHYFQTNLFGPGPPQSTEEWPPNLPVRGTTPEQLPKERKKTLQVPAKPLTQTDCRASDVAGRSLVLSSHSWSADLEIHDNTVSSQSLTPELKDRSDCSLPSSCGRPLGNNFHNEFWKQRQEKLVIALGRVYRLLFKSCPWEIIFLSDWNTSPPLSAGLVPLWDSLVSAPAFAHPWGTLWHIERGSVPVAMNIYLYM